MVEEKGTCCGKCGHVHVKGTSCPKPFLTGKRHCNRRTNENAEGETSLIDAVRKHASHDINSRDFKRSAIAKKYLKDLEQLSTWEEMSKYATDMGLDAVRKGQYTKAAMFTTLSKVINTHKPVEEMHTMHDDGPDEFHQVHADVEENSKGLWANIRAKRARGEKPARKGSEDYKKAVSAAKRINAMDETDEYCPHCLAEYILECWNSGMIEEAEYRGKKVSLGKPFLTPGGPKKRSVYVKNAKGNVVKVNFGDPNMRIKKSNPKRRKSYRARHHCDNPGPRWKANYWSCKAW